MGIHLYASRSTSKVGELNRDHFREEKTLEFGNGVKVRLSKWSFQMALVFLVWHKGNWVEIKVRMDKFHLHNQCYRKTISEMCVSADKGEPPKGRTLVIRRCIYFPKRFPVSFCAQRLKPRFTCWTGDFVFIGKQVGVSGRTTSSPCLLLPDRGGVRTNRKLRHRSQTAGVQNIRLLH